MLSFVIAEEDLRIETSYPFNEVTAVFLFNNSRYHHTSHMDSLVHPRSNNHVTGSGIPGSSNFIYGVHPL